MRSYKNPDIFFKKMKKKPAQQAVIDNIESYTEEQINALTGSHFPAWIREELIKIKRRGTTNTSEDMAKKIADMMIAASQNNK